MPCLVPSLPSRRSALAALLCALLASLGSCGGGGAEDPPSGGSSGLGGGGGSGTGGGGEGGGEGGGSGSEPPPDTGDMEGFGVWPGSAPGFAPGARLAGFVGYRNTPRLAQMTTDATAQGGLYRRSWFVNEPETGQNIGEDFLWAQAHGHRLWLNVIGTPVELSPHPEQTENEYTTGVPQYARYAPTDPVAWADLVLGLVADMEAAHGVVPDCIEIWNEVERPEWFIGTLREFLDLYVAASNRIRALRPGIRVGGPGLAGYSSAMDGEESVLLALIREAAATGAPLDFVSWHHYAPGAEILFSDMPNRARDLADSLGLPAIEAIVSEWNIAPSAEGAAGPQFDGSHAAANYANFFAAGYERALDGNMFFLDVDEDNDAGIIDLMGMSLGALTMHGIKKPVFRVLEALHAMTREDILPVYQPEQDEFSLRVFASRAADRTRIVVSNDVVTGLWVFANRSRQNGMEPGWLHPIWLAAGGPQADEQDLIEAGLTPEQAAAVIGFMPEVYRADNFVTEPRPVVVTILGEEGFAVGPVMRFDATHNAPAQFREDLLPELQQAEADAAWTAAAATAAHLTGLGYPYTAAEILAVPAPDFFEWAALEGIPYGYAVSAFKIRRDTLRDERLAYAPLLNSQPETALQVESAADVGLVVDGRKLRFLLEPDTVLILDLNH